jgi:hypothetical protein
VVAMSRWDVRGVGGCGRRFEGRVGEQRGRSTAYDGMGLSRPRDCVCRCSLASSQQLNEHKVVLLEGQVCSPFLGEEEETASGCPGLLFRFDGAQVRFAACPGMLCEKIYRVI